MSYLPSQLPIKHKNKSTNENITKTNLQPMSPQPTLNYTPNAMDCFPISPIHRLCAMRQGCGSFPFEQKCITAALMR
jgi:hypothetical protein